MLAYIDRLFKKYGEEVYGAEAMGKLTDQQIEEARCETFRLMSEMTEKLGKLPKGTEKKIFCNFIFVKLLEREEKDGAEKIAR